MCEIGYGMVSMSFWAEERNSCYVIEKKAAKEFWDMLSMYLSLLMIKSKMGAKILFGRP